MGISPGTSLCSFGISICHSQRYLRRRSGSLHARRRRSVISERRNIHPRCGSEPGSRRVRGLHRNIESWPSRAKRRTNLRSAWNRLGNPEQDSASPVGL
jgi:hypothetical protein